MSFTDTGELGKALISYIKEGQGKDNQNLCMSSDTSMEIETDVTERYSSYVNDIQIQWFPALEFFRTLKGHFNFL